MYGSSLNQFYPHYLGHLLGFWVTCGVKMMSLHHCWGWEPPQTASCIPIRHIQNAWAHLYAVHGHMAVISNSHTHLIWLRFHHLYLLSQIDGIMSLLRVTATSNCFLHPIRHRKRFWAHCYAVHRHMVAALHSSTHPTWVRFLGSLILAKLRQDRTLVVRV